ncbi:hypothetical protein NFI96_013332 [Prochilodus magdalenae]|nr:hypothetical protein NFI96_013332 [Prochilodus magdalenae]
MEEMGFLSVLIEDNVGSENSSLSLKVVSQITFHMLEVKAVCLLCVLVLCKCVGSLWLSLTLRCPVGVSQCGEIATTERSELHCVDQGNGEHVRRSAGVFSPPRCPSVFRTCGSFISGHRTLPHRTLPHRTPPHRTLPHRTLSPQDAGYRTLPHRTLPTGRWLQDAAPQDAAHRTLPTGRRPTGRCPQDAGYRTLPTGLGPTGRYPQGAVGWIVLVGGRFSVQQ